MPAARFRLIVPIPPVRGVMLDPQRFAGDQPASEERARKMLGDAGLRDPLGLPLIVRDTFLQEAGIRTGQRSQRTWTTKPSSRLCDCPADSYRRLSTAGGGGYTGAISQLTLADGTEHYD